ncbi:PoNe immunity protein domain-containing protein [Herbaspirillum autotrophicum]|uniref:PoNe immunity protein domain-containing protein n=1 Tax=Herbaspirillum autotrophicum TaxID=180195 RepID=UPI00067D94CF|nr:PoNe immunity protein domain-containing protein [Herbaspirillum autotrophicum]
MIRAPFCNQNYWDRWIGFLEEKIADQVETLKGPSANPQYRPQYAFTLVTSHLSLMLMRYSRGDAFANVGRDFLPMVSAWEEAERLHLERMSPDEYWRKFDWSKNLDHYIFCFWLAGLALSLNLPEDQWLRLIALIGNEGKDQLLDRVLATRQPTRLIGSHLCHPKPYRGLQLVLDSSEGEHAMLLKDFVEHWYEGLNRNPGNKKLSNEAAIYERPYWYRYGQTNMAGGAYFGQWCIEAVAVVKAFGVNDQLCLGHPQYPGDLLRPGQVTAPDMARLPEVLQAWSTYGEAEETVLDDHRSLVRKDVGIVAWLARFLGKKN